MKSIRAAIYPRHAQSPQHWALLCSGQRAGAWPGAIQGGEGVQTHPRGADTSQGMQTSRGMQLHPRRCKYILGDANTSRGHKHLPGDAVTSQGMQTHPGGLQSHPGGLQSHPRGFSHISWLLSTPALRTSKSHPLPSRITQLVAQLALASVS